MTFNGYKITINSPIENACSKLEHLNCELIIKESSGQNF